MPVVVPNPSAIRPVVLPDSAAIRALKQKAVLEAEARFNTTNVELAALFRSYVQGFGTFDDWQHHEIRERIDHRSMAAGVSDGSVFDRFRQLERTIVERVAPELAGELFDPAPHSLFDVHTITPDSVNEYWDDDDTMPNRMLLRHKMRPSFRIYSIDQVELYVDPYRYQLISRFKNWFFPSASPKSLSRLALTQAISGATPKVVDRHVVIIQDRFPGGNFAHFLFDWVTRIGHFCESGLVDPKDCLFVMGGAPGTFEALLLRALISRYGLCDDSFLYPSEALVLRTAGNVYWFCDQVELYMHPAQMAHERSVAMIREVARDVPDMGVVHNPDRFARIYLSRADATRRRVANEAELFASLRGLGFEYVVMSDHSVEDQIAIVRRTQCVVAPHGMGLTLLSLHLGTPALVELHRPGEGTDAYAFMARAMGFPYRCVAGGEGDSDFAVPIGEVLRMLADVGVTEPLPGQPVQDESRKFPAEGNATKWSAGAGLVATPPDHPPDLTATDSPLMRHTRIDAERGADTNVGAWANLDVEGGRVYTASCWIWIPQDFPGTSVALSLGEWSGQRRVVADLSRRATWQRLQASRTAPLGVTGCHIVLRMEAPDGAFVLSTGWRLDVGPCPSD